MAQRVVKGDMVQVTAGKHKGSKGRVVKVLKERNRVCVEGIATLKRHLKPGKDPKHEEGGIIEKLGSIDLSNVMLVDPESGKTTRVGFNVTDDGRKVRVARRSGVELL
jgi:large subunit ribosomal protein L24